MIDLFSFFRYLFDRFILSHDNFIYNKKKQELAQGFVSFCYIHHRLGTMVFFLHAQDAQPVNF